MAYRDPLVGLRGHVEAKRATLAELTRRWTPVRERMMALEHHNAFVLARLAVKTEVADLPSDAWGELEGRLDVLEIALREALRATDELLALPPSLPPIARRDATAPPSASTEAARALYAALVPRPLARWGDEGWTSRFDDAGAEHELAIEATHGFITCFLNATMPLALPIFRVTPRRGTKKSAFEDVFDAAGDQATALALLDPPDVRSILLDLANRSVAPSFPDLQVGEGRVQIAWAHDANADARALLDLAVRLTAKLRAEATR